MDMYNEKKKETIKTFGPPLINYDSLEKVQFDFVDKLMVVSMWKLENENDYKGNDATKGDISFGLATASMFLDELEDARDSFKKGEPFDSMINCGIVSNNGIAITDGSMIKRPYGMYLIIYKDIKENKIPTGMWVYSLKTGIAIKNYDPRNGSGEVKMNKSREIKDLIYTFEEFVKSANRAASHAIKESDKFFRKSVMDRLIKNNIDNGGSSYSNNASSYNKPKKANIFDEDHSYKDLSDDFSAALSIDYNN